MIRLRPAQGLDQSQWNSPEVLQPTKVNDCTAWSLKMDRETMPNFRKIETAMVESALIQARLVEQVPKRKKSLPVSKADQVNGSKMANRFYCTPGDQ